MNGEHEELWQDRDAMARNVRALTARAAASERKLLDEIEELKQRLGQVEAEMWGAHQVEAENLAHESARADAAA